MVTVIIPTLNEAAIIEFSLKNLLNHERNFEVVIADGGSSDGTLDLISQFPQVRCVRAPKGRGRQMNAGARAARGDMLLFLHADTCLPPGALQHVIDALSDCSVVGGSFCLSFDHSNLFLRGYSLFSKINHILFTYGDQALFLRKSTFEAIGGFKDIPIMEDVEIQVRLRRMGRFTKICEPVTTSARRFLQCGIIRQQILNTVLVGLYYVGVPLTTIKKFYSDSEPGKRENGDAGKKLAPSPSSPRRTKLTL